nr:phosphatase PAP2 family protein [Kineococcus vitellinus]
MGLTEVLKLWLLQRPDLSERYGEMANSLPSGHTSAVLGLALGACVAAPRLLRAPLALVGAAAATTIGAFVVTEGWHRVSDVLASALVGSIVLCCALALPTRGARRRGAVAALALLVPAACAAVLAVVYLLGTSTLAAALAAGAVVGLTVLLGARAVPREVRPGR